MKIADVISFLNDQAPPVYQEDYDNSGLLIGDANAELKGVLVALDCTEEVIKDAVSKGCNLVVAHHPLIFRGLKRLTGKNYVEKTVIKAIQENVAVYAIHTNLDNVIHGVNRKIGEKLGLKDLRILSPKKEMLRKLVVYAPQDHLESLKSALFSAGAGNIGNYSECSFSISGEGTFKGNDSSQPFVGQKGERHTEKEGRLEVIYPIHAESSVLTAMRKAHPYEEIAYDCLPLKNSWQELGAGMVGRLEEPMDEMAFLKMVKERFHAGVIRHTQLLNRKVETVAFCGGSGSFLLKDAIASGADVYITGDFKYHEFFDAEGKLVIADIGHFESEQFTQELLCDWLREKFPTFAVHFTEVDTNPVNYL